MRTKKNEIKEFALLGVVAVILTILALIFKQDFVKMCPLYISLFVSLFQSRVSRWAPLIGGINSILYTVVYVSYKLYGIAAQSLLISFPIQIIAFLNWTRKTDNNVTVLKKLSAKKRIFAFVLFAVTCIGSYFVLMYFESSYAFLDTAASIIGTFALVMMMLAYEEYVPLMLVSLIATALLYLSMIFDSPEQVTYLAFTFYQLYCNIIAFVRLKKRNKCTGGNAVRNAQ